jgi:hypothetical protein
MNDYVIDPTFDENRIRPIGSERPVLNSLSKLSGAQDAAYKVKRRNIEKVLEKSESEKKAKTRAADRATAAEARKKASAEAKIAASKKTSYDHVKFAEADGRIPQTKHLANLTSAEISNAQIEGRAVARAVAVYRQPKNAQIPTRSAGTKTSAPKPSPTPKAKDADKPAAAKPAAKTTRAPRAPKAK